jgi:NADP-dependent 3-hydroxy acid dehydrogenase YdfG
MSAPGGEARTALVTGASSGIGAAIAKAFGALGWRVAIGARRTDRLAEVALEVDKAGGRGFAHPLDVTQADSIDAFVDAARAALGPADVVVSNAGVGVPNLLHEARVEDLRREIDTNLFGPILLARRVIPALVELGRGDLVFVSSLNAVAPRTFQAAYTAAKAGLEGLARVVQMELEGTGVRSTIVRPGPTGSEFGAKFGGAMSRRLLASWQYWGVMRQLHWMYPEHVAQAVVAVVTAPPGTHFDVIEVLPENPKRGPL